MGHQSPHPLPTGEIGNYDTQQYAFQRMPVTAATLAVIMEHVKDPAGILAVVAAIDAQSPATPATVADDSGDTGDRPETYKERKRRLDRERIAEKRRADAAKNVATVADDTATNGDTPSPLGPPSLSPDPKTLPPIIPPSRELTLVSLPEIDQVSRAFEVYNDAARRYGFPQALKANDQRRRRMKARLRECGGLEGWRAALDRAGASKFCRGETNGFKADLDFLLQEQSLIRLMEGRYDDRVQASGKYNTHDSIQQGFALVDREGEDGESQDRRGDDTRLLS